MVLISTKQQDNTLVKYIDYKISRHMIMSGKLHSQCDIVCISSQKFNNIKKRKSHVLYVIMIHIFENSFGRILLKFSLVLPTSENIK